MRKTAVSKEVVEYVLENAVPAALVDKCLALVHSAPAEFRVEAGETIADCLAGASGDPARRDDILARLVEQDRRNPLAWFVRAGLLAHGGQAEAAIDALQQTQQLLPAPNPHVLLRRARLLARKVRFPEAIADLQLALNQFPSCPFFVKCEKVVDRIIASRAWRPRRRAKVAVLGSATTALLAPVLRASGFRGGIELDIYEGPYGNYAQEILDPNSGLARFRPDIVLLILNHRDLSLPSSGGKDQALLFCERLRELWTVLRERTPCHIVQVGFDQPRGGGWGPLEDTLPEGRRRAIALANLRLSENLPAGVSFLDANAVAAQVGSEFASEKEWFAARQYPSTAALPLFADHLCAHCRAALGLASKVLVLDLDNTLWGGVVAEDGLDGIRIGPPTAEGEGYLELQKYAKELKQRGVLLAVCSKNNQADAELPFLKHDSMHLRLNDFVAFAANWRDKAGNLRSMAEGLSLGLESFVFLDDNSAERALVRSQLPEVAVPECGDTPWEMLASLRRGLYFESIVLTREDIQRHAGYQGNLARKTLEKSASSLDEFLRSLEMAAEHGPIDGATLTRATQLINKTNQFNLTTRRYTEEQLRRMASSPDWWCRWFKLADRFGDHGLVGVMLAEKSRNGWKIDTWLMSCRVLGRTMEDFMFAALLSAARAEGARTVFGRFIPTEKNAPVKDLFIRLGFDACAEDLQQYVLDLQKPPPAKKIFIQDMHAAPPAPHIACNTTLHKSLSRHAIANFADPQTVLIEK